MTNGPNASDRLTANALPIYPMTSTVVESAKEALGRVRRLAGASNDKSSTEPCLRLVHTKADQGTSDEVENREDDTASKTWNIFP
jgi:hypothetical protein